MTMALSISVVGVSSYLVGEAERLAMEVDVFTAVNLVRYRMTWIVWPFHASLLFLWASAALLVFATCHNDINEQGESTGNEALCNWSGGFVVMVFLLVGGSLVFVPRWLIASDLAKAHQRQAASRHAASQREPLRRGPASDAFITEDHSLDFEHRASSSRAPGGHDG
jgi:hypothetical protein